jgi:hypothetical protein
MLFNVNFTLKSIKFAYKWYIARNIALHLIERYYKNVAYFKDEDKP